MLRELLGIILKTIVPFGKWTIAVFGGLVGYVLFVLDVVRPKPEMILCVTILPPAGMLLVLFIYQCLRRVSELSRSLKESSSGREELSRRLTGMMDSLAIMERKLISLGGGILQKSVNEHVRLDIDGTWHCHVQIEIEVSERVLSNLYHYNAIGSSRGTFFQNYNISHRTIYCEPNSKIRWDILKRPTEASPNHIDINLTFSPPLTKGGKVCYEYKESYKGASAMTREAASIEKQARTFFRNEDIEVDGYEILGETEKISRQIIFPPDYDISSPTIAVLYRGNRIKEEEDRAQQYFKAQIINNCWILEFSLAAPKLWHTYYFTWVPPLEREYRQLLLNQIK